MMSPSDSDLQQRIISVLINYFLQQETSAAAVQTTLAHLSSMEQEYSIRDNSSWSAIITSKVTLPIPFISLGRDAHLEKIKACQQALEYATVNQAENLGKAALKILLEFFIKSDDWHVAGYVRGASINMRLACGLLQAAGVKPDCGPFLQKYSNDFLKELEAAANKVVLPIAVATSSEPLKTPTFVPKLESAVAMTPFKDTVFPIGSQKLSIYVADTDSSQKRFNNNSREPAPSPSPPSAMFALD